MPAPLKHREKEPLEDIDTGWSLENSDTIECLTKDATVDIEGM